MKPINYLINRTSFNLNFGIYKYFPTPNYFLSIKLGKKKDGQSVMHKAALLILKSIQRSWIMDGVH